MGSELRPVPGLFALILRIDGALTDRARTDGPDLGRRQEIDLRLGDKPEIVGVSELCPAIGAGVVMVGGDRLLNLIDDQIHILWHRAKSAGLVKRNEGAAAFGHVFINIVHSDLERQLVGEASNNEHSVERVV